MKKNFKFIGNIDVQNIREQVLLISEDIWNHDTSRQEIETKHSSTNFVPIKWNYESLTTGKEAEVNTEYVEQFNLQNFIEEITDIIKKSYGNGTVVRMLFTRMNPNSKILPHKDAGESLIRAHRIHVPIFTNENCLFTVNEETINMKPGEIWEIDNSETHSVENNSNNYRIHFIIDYMSKGLL